MRNMSASPATERVIALRGEFVLVPSAEALLTQLHLLVVGVLTLLFDLCVVGVAFATASSPLATAEEDQGREHEGAGCGAAGVDCDLGSLGEVLEFLRNREGGFLVLGLCDGLRCCGVTTIGIVS